MDGLSTPLIDAEKETLLSAAMTLLKFAWPSILSFILQFTVELINMFYIGNIDLEKLDGVGLGNMWGNFIGISVGWGLAGGIDTLCSQAHGNKQYAMVGIWLQRGLFVLSVAFIPISIGFLYTTEVLMLMGIPEKLAVYSYNYLSVVLYGLWFFLSFDFYRRFLQAQGYFWPGLAVNATTTTLHIFWDWLFAVHFNLAERGVGYATAITYFSNFFFMLSIIRIFDLDRKVCLKCDFDNFGPEVYKFLKYALPSAGAMVFDQLNFEITQFEASFLGPKAQAAHVSVATTTTFLFMIPLGLGISTCAVVGNLVGNEESYRAKLYSWASAILALCINGFFNIIAIVFRVYISNLYTYDTEVAEMISALLIPGMLFNMIDSLQAVLCGAMKGIAQQKIAFLAIFMSYYIFALPMGYVLGFHAGYGIYGIWYAMLLGTIMAASILVYVLLKSDWVAQTIKDEK